MRLKDYARDQKKRKKFVQQPELLMIGVDMSKAKHGASIASPWSPWLALPQPCVRFSPHAVRQKNLANIRRSPY